jgi:hypothetical protein
MNSLGEDMSSLRSTLELYGQPWEPREYLIVLAVYFQNRNLTPMVDSGLVRDIAALLGRTPAAIVMRMENYASLDQEVSRKGLVHVSPECRRLFAEWRDRPDYLIATAGFLREEILSRVQPGLFDTPRVRMPEAFRRYELLEPIGKGGFGAVFSCIQRETGRSFAIKIIRGDRVDSKEAIGRFAREIKALKAISCPSIIRLYEDNLEEESRYPAFIMDLAIGSLSEFIERNAIAVDGVGARPLLPFRTAFDIMRSMISAVQTLHSSVPLIVHRDINPNNILQLINGQWVLADFSLAKFLPANISSTLSSQTQRGWGTIHYAPPEQREFFRYTDHRADIYALGVLLWELFSSAWPPPSREASGLPAKFVDLFQFAAAEEYEGRCPSIDNFAEIFEGAISQLSQEECHGEAGQHRPLKEPR